jgi:hypothetical protein
MIPDPQDGLPAPLPVLAYATPAVYRAEVRRERRYVVVPHGLDLPDRCVVCNAPAHVRMRIWAGIRPDGMGYLSRTYTMINAGFCRIHAGRPRRAFWIRVGIWATIALAAIGLNFIVRCIDPDALTAGYSVGAFAILIMLISLTAPARPLTCRRCDAHAVWLKGASDAFLESLPRDPV